MQTKEEILTSQRIYDIVADLKAQKIDVAKFVLSFTDYNKLLKEFDIPDRPQITLMGMVVTFNHTVPNNCCMYELARPDAVCINQNLLDEVNRLNGVVRMLEGSREKDIEDALDRNRSNW